ncbi:phage tail tape measure protein [Acetobacter orientalis]|uniref:Phage tail tape measure protein n=1 Tax=Acetobacter orientalis TaxID=146474 RepID=A0A2Z5ZHN4_9PROT|nr:phage tail tape measure protein [Acetobacter orientalis]
MAQGSYQLSVGITGNATKVLKQINAQMKAAQAPAKAFQKQLGDFKKLTGFDQVSKSIGGVKSALMSVIPGLSAITGVASIGGILALSKGFADMGLHITQMSNALGLAGVQIRNMQGAGSLLGVGSGLLDTRKNAQDLQFKMRAGMLSPEEIAASQKAHILTNDSAKTRQNKSLDFLANAKSSGASASYLRYMAQLLGVDEKLIGTTHQMVDAQEALAAKFLRTNQLGEDGIKSGFGLYQAFTSVKQATEGVSTAIMAALAPSITPLLNQFANWLSTSQDVQNALDSVKATGQQFAAWIKSVNWSEVGTEIGSWIPSINTVKVILEALVAVKVASFATGLVSSFMTMTTAAIGLGRGLIGAGAIIAGITAPIAIAIAAVTALGVAAYEIYSHWDKVGPYFKATWDTITDGFNVAVDALTPLAHSFEATMSGMWDGIKGAADLAWSYIAPIFDKAKAAINWVADTKVGKALGWVAKKGISAAKSIASPITSDFQKNLASEQSKSGSSGVSATAIKSMTSDGVIAALESQGLNHANALGYAANMKKESNFNPFAVGDGGHAFGIGQWHEDRQAAYAKMFGHTMQSVRNAKQALEEQTKFYVEESKTATGGRVFQKLQGNTNAGIAAATVSKSYERPADQRGEMADRARIAYALDGKAAPINATAPTAQVAGGQSGSSSFGGSGNELVITFENAPAGMKVDTSRSSMNIRAKIVPATVGSLA